MASRPLDLVPFASQTDARGLQAKLAELGQSAVIVSPAIWLNAKTPTRLPRPTLILFGERDYPLNHIRATLKARSVAAMAIFLRDVAMFNPEIAASCFDFVSWPCAEPELKHRIDRLIGPQEIHEPPKDELRLLEEFADLNLLGRSQAFVSALKLIKRVARSDASVMIVGETGTGKELAARAIHYMSARRDRPFIPVNCGALPDNLFENELFGHARGAFTDARETQPGLVALADGGTLFLDEVDALSSKGQVALLRFLQDQQYRPLGGRELKQANIRVLAAANVDLVSLTTLGRFRADLLFRLRVLSVNLPPLRERRGDIALLAEHFLSQCRQRYNQPGKHFSAETLHWLHSQDWPGNIRELESAIHRGFILAEGDQVRLQNETLHGGDRRNNLDERRLAHASCDLGLREYKNRAIARLEKNYLTALITETNGNVSLAARRAGKERRAFGKLLQKYGIEKIRNTEKDK